MSVVNDIVCEPLWETLILFYGFAEPGFGDFFTYADVDAAAFLSRDEMFNAVLCCGIDGFFVPKFPMRIKGNNLVMALLL